MTEVDKAVERGLTYPTREYRSYYQYRLTYDDHLELQYLQGKLFHKNTPLKLRFTIFIHYLMTRIIPVVPIFCLSFVISTFYYTPQPLDEDLAHLFQQLVDVFS